LAKKFNETAEALGAEVQRFVLNRLSFKGCQACDTCETKLDRCVLKDDLAQVLESVKYADILVLATPVYFADISAQLKAFVDRCYSYFVPFEKSPDQSRLAPGKRMVFVITQNQSNENMFADVYVKYDLIFQVLGFTDNRLIRGCDLKKADDLIVKERYDLIRLVEETARDMIE
jgi:multimeric flavodoxin WrbA